MAYNNESDVGVSLGFATDDIAVAGVYQNIASDVLQREDDKISLMSSFMSLLGTYGLIRQWELLDRQTDLNERMVDYSERYLMLAEDNYQDITLDAYTGMRQLFDRFVANFQAFETEFLNFASQDKTYTANYPLHEGRAMAGVGQQYSLLRQRRARQRRRYDRGLCCSEDLTLDIAQAQALTDAAQRGFRYEDEKKMRLDEFFWSKYSTAMQMVENMRANVITGLNGGVANATGAIQAISGVLSQGIQATRGASAAIQDQASFFGTLSNGAFEAIGFSRGRQSVGTNYGPLTSGMTGIGELMGMGSARSGLSQMSSGGIQSGFRAIPDNLSTALGSALGVFGSNTY